MKIIAPSTGWISTHFGERAYTGAPPHNGTDWGFFTADPGSRRIRAAKTAAIVYAGPGASSGLPGGADYGTVIVQGFREDDADFKLAYCHLASVAVASGAPTAGTDLAEMGDTGKAFGVHLHFMVLRNGVPVNPEDYLSAAASLDPTPIIERKAPLMLLTRVLSGRVDFRTPLGKAPVRTLAHFTLLSRMLKAEPGGFDTFNDDESAILDGYIEAANTVGEAQTKEIVAALGKITIDPTPLVDEVKAALAGLSVDEAAIAAAVDAALYNDFGAIPTTDEIAQAVRNKIIKP